jgi:3-oxoacyl-(acyl-carrier-protein) synthase
MPRSSILPNLGKLTVLGKSADHQHDVADQVEASWSRLLAGRLRIRRLSDDVVGDLPAKIGGAVPSLEEDPEAGFDPDAVLPPKDHRKVDRFILFALAAAEEALERGLVFAKVPD